MFKIFIHVKNNILCISLGSILLCLLPKCCNLFDVAIFLCISRKIEIHILCHLVVQKEIKSFANKKNNRVPASAYWIRAREFFICKDFQRRVLKMISIISFKILVLTAIKLCISEQKATVLIIFWRPELLLFVDCFFC